MATARQGWDGHVAFMLVVAMAHVVVAQRAYSGTEAALVDVSLGDPGFPPQTVAPNLHTAPMLMVHLPKCAGTSTRNALYDIMAKQGTPPERLCIPGTPATPMYTILNVSDCKPELREADGRTPIPLSRDSPFVLAAGHFKYDWTVKELVRISQAQLDPGTNLPCLTYIRHPVERLVSFYYWVFDRAKLAAPLLQTMDPVEALHRVSHTSLKAFFYHHMPLLTLFGNMSRREVVMHNETAMQAAAVRARANLSKCLVGVTEDSQGTHELLSYYFPWAADRLRPDAMPHTNQRRDVDSVQRSPLPAETERLIRHYYHYEMHLYDHALAVHRAQVHRVRALRAR